MEHPRRSLGVLSLRSMASAARPRRSRARREARARERVAFLDYWGRGEWGDPHGLLGAAPAAIAAAAVDVLVCGHSHQPGVVAVPGGTYRQHRIVGVRGFDVRHVCDGRIEVRRWPSKQRSTTRISRHPRSRRREVVLRLVGSALSRVPALRPRRAERAPRSVPTRRSSLPHWSADVARVVHGRARWLVELLTRA